MRIIAVDDERLQLATLVKLIERAKPDAELLGFTDPVNAWEYVKEHEVDVAFLDVQMPEMNGIILAKKIKELYSKCNIIFCTAYNEYAMDAIHMRASGYLTKPIQMDQVCNELNNLRFPITESFKDEVSRAEGPRVYIQCFGNFEVFIDNQPFAFPGDKARELVAYLTDRKGASCLVSEIESVIFDDGKMHTSYMQKLRRELKIALRNVGCEDLITMSWGKMALNRGLVICDYYEWLEGTARGINAYQGEYMNNYSWAEFTNGLLYNK